MSRFGLALLAIVLAAQTPQSERIVAITGGKLLTISHGTIPDGVLLIQGKRISAVGPSGSVAIPTGAQIVDAKGMTVYPGWIDSESNLGLVETELNADSRDLAESSDEIFPHMHVADAFHAESVHIPVARANGILNAVIAPGTADSMPGQDIFVQLAGRDRDEMILYRDFALPINFSGAQRRESPQFPVTRMGLAAQLRQTFLDAQEYKRKLDEYEKQNSASAKNRRKKSGAERPDRDLKLEALIPYLEGRRPVVLGAYDSGDVETAMGIAREFHLKVVISHLTRSQTILDEVAAWHVPVIVGPLYDLPRANERYDAVYSLPAELVKRGIKIAFASYGADAGHGAPSLGFTRDLPYAAGYAVAYGLPYDEALKALTLNPAQIWGVDDKLGSLDPGKTANVVIANGDPLDVKTEVKQVFIAGQAISLETRQTRLRDQYK
ncbi:MAG TPA: amidohydrolase family protein [Bryobacteraceae bacterium]|jgi:imidazolonepropionase-like amidohydrolase|nr:amidohydrolase family protein [Bryobacteraceae bacterium]